MLREMRRWLDQGIVDSQRELQGDVRGLRSAEHALAHAGQLPTHVREERRAEFESLVESLAAEIEQALGPLKGLT